MRFVWSTALKDLKRHRRDPLGLALWLGIPLLIGALLVSISGGKGGPDPRAHVLVADLDDSFGSGLLLTALGQEEMGGLIQTEKVELEEGRARMNAGDATALLVIPSGFGQAILEETPTELRLLTNPAQSILPAIVEETLGILVDGTFYLHRVFGDEMRMIASGPPGGATLSNPQIAQLSTSISTSVQRVGQYLSPPLIQVEFVAAVDEEEEHHPIALLFMPGILFMALLFMAQGLGIDLWTEREERTMRRVLYTPQRVTAFVAGKFLSGTVILLAVATIVLVVGYGYFALPWGSLALAIAWTVLSGLLLLSMMSVIQVHMATRRGAGVLTNVLIFPLMMAGGSFFPFEAMPEWMRAIGRFTPNGWALVELKTILDGAFTVESFAIAFGGVALVTIVLFLLTARRIRSGFAQG